MLIRLLPFLFAIWLIVSQNATLHCSGSPLETYLEDAGYARSFSKEVYVPNRACYDQHILKEVLLPNRTGAQPEVNLILDYIIICFGLFMGVLAAVATCTQPVVPLLMFIPALLFVISLRSLNQNIFTLFSQSMNKLGSFIIEFRAPKSQKRE